MNTSDLRARLSDLEAALHTAGARLATAETAYQRACRIAIERGDMALTAETEAELRAARAAYARATEAMGVARSMLREAEAAEATVARRAAVQAIESDLAQVAAVAAQADAAFASMMDRLEEMRAIELRIRAAVRRDLQDDVAGGIQTLSGLDNVRTYLGTLRNGGAPDMAPWHTATADSIARAVRRTTARTDVDAAHG